jgi:CRP-like cAMP-binding protein
MTASDHTQNCLLLAFPPDVAAHLNGKQERMPFAHVVFQFGEEAKEAFFPQKGTVISLIRGSLDGGDVEVGVVAREGFTEIHSLLASPSYRAQGIVQAEGLVTRVSLAALRDVLGSDQAARNLLLGYVSVHLEQVTQNALCNGIHTIEQRLSKWLLIMRDRVGNDTLHLKHEFLAHMLGIRRSGVTVAVGKLTDCGLIEHARNKIVLLKPSAIEERACDCYAAITDVHEAFNARLRGGQDRSGSRHHTNT